MARDTVQASSPTISSQERWGKRKHTAWSAVPRGKSKTPRASS